MLNRIIDILEHGNLFLTGGGGVGKSYMVGEIVKFYKKAKKSVVMLGSTGISAVNIGGVTVHRFFKFGISNSLDELRERDALQERQLNELQKILQKCDLIVIDEISMISANLLEMIVYRLKTFGFRGRVLIVGDFYQLPPVRKSKNREESDGLFEGNEAYFAFETQAWSELGLTCVELTRSKRTNDDRLFQILAKVRVGECDAEVCELLSSRLVSEFPPDITVLFGVNEEANAHNAERLSVLPGKKFRAMATKEKKDPRFTDEAFERWVENLRAPEVFEFKIGARVIFTINKDGQYYNGECGYITDIKNSDGKGEIYVKKDSGECICVERYEHTLCDYEGARAKKGEESGGVKEKVRAVFKQFPLKLAYGITIHKSQGMSLARFGCDLGRIFENGQAYVALSRARSLEGMFLRYNKNESFGEFLVRRVSASAAVREFYESCERVLEDELVGEFGGGVNLSSEQFERGRFDGILDASRFLAGASVGESGETEEFGGCDADEGFVDMSGSKEWLRLVAEFLETKRAMEALEERQDALKAALVEMCKGRSSQGGGLTLLCRKSTRRDWAGYAKDAGLKLPREYVKETEMWVAKLENGKLKTEN